MFEKSYHLLTSQRVKWLVAENPGSAWKGSITVAMSKLENWTKEESRPKVYFFEGSEGESEKT